MDPRTRAQLTASLSALSQSIAKDLQAQLLASAEGSPLRTAALALHQDERVGASFDVWTDLLSRRAAVLWVLKSVYVRVLEDRGLLTPKRIIDPESHALFSRLAPDLGDTAYLRWCYADLAKPDSGLAELFIPQPAELTWPSNPSSRALLDFWRARDPDTGKLRYTFEDERFDGRLMGDLYQDLDPVVKERYALLQTPDFVLDFILDETLTPAIAHFGIDQVRVIDPACGSGHFLLGAFRRLVTGLCQKANLDKPTRAIVTDALSRVVGIDLNDYACALARARLLMAAVELLDASDLSVARDLHPQVFLADALDQLDDLQGDMFAEGASAETLAAMSHEDTRRRLKKVLAPGFHGVLANPPYITEKDETKRAYHREKVGRSRRYISANGKYSLASPFTERAFQLAVQGGYVGLITSNNFMKREFGKALIEEVLAKIKLTKIVDTSGAYIPGHGTPTVILFGRRLPLGQGPVYTVMGKRGEPRTPEDPARGLVWQGLLAANADANFENEFVSAALTDRAVFSKHPWSLRGGGAAEIKTAIEDAATHRLASIASAVGITSVTGEDAVYLTNSGHATRVGTLRRRALVIGESIRDWSIGACDGVVWPYNSDLVVDKTDNLRAELVYLWPYRTNLSRRKRFGTPMLERGLTWYELQELYADKLRSPLSIAFAAIATHNHFVLDRGGKVFKQSAPVIKLPESATEDDHLALLGLLNSSTACFWMKQVFHCKGGQGINEGAKSEGWEQFYDFDSTKLKPFPIPAAPAVKELARYIDIAARSRQSAGTLLGHATWRSTAELQALLAQRRARDLDLFLQMVSLQEELDWCCYGASGLVPQTEVRSPDEAPQIRPTQRPVELLLAERDAEIRTAREAGEDGVDQPTAWFERHGWAPEYDITDVSPEYAALVRNRLALIAATPALELIETPMYKRRWYKPDYDAEEQAALEAWLLDRLEAWAQTRTTPFTPDEAASALQHDAQLLAVLEVRTNRRDFDLATELASRIQSESVPNQKHHRYKPSGLIKRATWEETWRLQHEEDQGKPVKPEVPSKYVGADFLKAEYFAHRGPLDVPKERFIALTEVPRQPTEPPLYLWAGLTPRQRANALLDLDETLSEAGVPVPDRHGLLHGIWTLLPYIAWDSKDAAEEIRSVLELEVGKDGITDAMLQTWAARFPPGTKSRARKPTPPKKPHA